MARPARLVIAASVLLVLTACTGATQNGPDASAPSADIGFGHVHGVDLNPADGLVYAATHYGLFRLGPDGPKRIADRYQDTMGFTVAGPDRFLGSGHPDLREPGPNHLGLIVSTDRAETWRPLSLQGEADFHALSTVGETVYGWNSRAGGVMRSDDGGNSWQRGALVAATDLDADPTNPGRVLATTERGLLESNDGGLTFAPAAVQPARPLVLLDHVEYLHGDRVPTAAGVDGSGGVWALIASGWIETGALGAPPQAFTVLGPDRYVAATDGGVLRSEDAGRTWWLVAAAHG